MKQIIAVGAGGFLGAVLRYILGGWLQNLIAVPWLQAGTLGVNAVGCFLLGMLGGWAEHANLFNDSQRLFLLVGLLGGFTTFSTFSFETLGLLRQGQMGVSLANIVMQLTFGLLAVWAGFAISALKFGAPVNG